MENNSTTNISVPVTLRGPVRATLKAAGRLYETASGDRVILRKDSVREENKDKKWNGMMKGHVSVHGVRYHFAWRRDRGYFEETPKVTAPAKLTKMEKE